MLQRPIDQFFGDDSFYKSLYAYNYFLCNGRIIENFLSTVILKINFFIFKQILTVVLCRRNFNFSVPFRLELF